jgi:DNA-binding PadR family transcriptional regulator
LILNDKPLHGYELIDELEKRSEGAWRPSPGTIYPALRRLESRGLIVGADDDGGKRVYSLTEDGAQRILDRDPDAPAPWALFAERGESLRPVAMELMSQIRQIGRFGSAEQRRQAAEVLNRTKAELYGLMAEGTDQADPAAADPTGPDAQASD